MYIYLLCARLYCSVCTVVLSVHETRAHLVTTPQKLWLPCMHAWLHIHHLWHILGYGDFQLIKVDTPFWGEVEQLSINKTIWIISLQHPINKGGLDKPFRGEDKVRVSISYI